MASLVTGRRALWAVALAGDLAIFAAFPFLGAANHENAVDAERFVRVFVPFAIAWPALGLAATAFASDTVRTARRTLVVVPPAWLAAGVIGIAIRVFLFDCPFSLAFSIVAVSLTGLLIVAWRLGLALALRGR
jgi:hypothetical protein